MEEKRSLRILWVRVFYRVSQGVRCDCSSTCLRNDVCRPPQEEENNGQTERYDEEHERYEITTFSHVRRCKNVQDIA